MRSAIFPDEATSGLCDRDAGNRPPCGDLGRGRKEKARARHSSSGSKDGIPYCLGSSSWDVPTAANTLTPPWSTLGACQAASVLSGIPPGSCDRRRAVVDRR